MIIDEVLSCSSSWWKRTAGSVPDCEQARMYDTQIFESSSDPIWTMRAHCSVAVVRFQGGGLRLDTEEERVSELRLVRRRDGWQGQAATWHWQWTEPHLSRICRCTNRVCHGDLQEKQEKRLQKHSPRWLEFQHDTRIQKDFRPAVCKIFLCTQSTPDGIPRKRIARVASQ